MRGQVVASWTSAVVAEGRERGVGKRDALFLLFTSTFAQMVTSCCPVCC